MKAVMNKSKRIFSNTKPLIKRVRSALVLATAMLVACAGVPVEPVKQEPVFYPPLPQSPRIQYLATFSSLEDLTGEDSSFGEFLFGEEDRREQSLIKKAYGVGFYKGALFAVDTRGPGYVMFDLKNQRVHTFSGNGMNRPINITFDEVGNRYIADPAAGKILLFNAENKYVRSFTGGKDFRPSDVLIYEDKLYVVETKNHRIQVLAKRDGKQLLMFGKAGSKDGELFQPTNIKLGKDGYLYIADTGNFRIQAFTLEGEFVRSFGSVGSGLGQFARPKGLAIDKQGLIYSADSAFNLVQIFQSDGQLLLFFGGAGEGPENMLLPADVEISYDDLGLYQKYAHPDFKLEYVIAVSNQFGPNKVIVYGFGKMKNMDYQ